MTTEEKTDNLTETKEEPTSTNTTQKDTKTTPPNLLQDICYDILGLFKMLVCYVLYITGRLLQLMGSLFLEMAGLIKNHGVPILKQTSANTSYSSGNYPTDPGDSGPHGANPSGDGTSDKKKTKNCIGFV